MTPTHKVKPRGWRHEWGFCQAFSERTCRAQAQEHLWDGFVGLNTLMACAPVGEHQAQVQWVSFHEKNPATINPLTLLWTNCHYHFSVFGAWKRFSFWKYGPNTFLKRPLYWKAAIIANIPKQNAAVSFDWRDKKTWCALVVRHCSKAGKVSPVGLFNFCGNFAGSFT